MVSLNNIDVSPKRKSLKPDPSKIPDIDDPNNRFMSCDFTYKNRRSYRTHLINVYDMTHLRPPKEPQMADTKTSTLDILNRHCNVCDKTYNSKWR